MFSLTDHRKFREIHKKSQSLYEHYKKLNPRAWQNAILKVKVTKVPSAKDPELSLRFTEELKLNQQMDKLNLPRDAKVSLLRYPDGEIMVFYPQKFGVGSFRI